MWVIGAVGIVRIRIGCEGRPPSPIELPAESHLIHTHTQSHRQNVSTHTGPQSYNEERGELNYNETKSGQRRVRAAHFYCAAAAAVCRPEIGQCVRNYAEVQGALDVDDDRGRCRVDFIENRIPNILCSQLFVSQQQVAKPHTQSSVCVCVHQELQSFHLREKAETKSNPPGCGSASRPAGPYLCALDLGCRCRINVYMHSRWWATAALLPQCTCNVQLIRRRVRLRVFDIVYIIVHVNSANNPQQIHAL